MNKLCAVQGITTIIMWKQIWALAHFREVTLLETETKRLTPPFHQRFRICVITTLTQEPRKYPTNKNVQETVKAYTFLRNVICVMYACNIDKQLQAWNWHGMFLGLKRSGLKSTLRCREDRNKMIKFNNLV